MANTINIDIPNYVSCSHIDDVQTLQTNKDENKLSIMHLNMRSIKNRVHSQEFLKFLGNGPI